MVPLFWLLGAMSSLPEQENEPSSFDSHIAAEETHQATLSSRCVVRSGNTH